MMAFIKGLHVLILKTKGKLIVWKAAEKSVERETFKILERKKRIIGPEPLGGNQIKQKVRSSVMLATSMRALRQRWVM